MGMDDLCMHQWHRNQQIQNKIFTENRIFEENKIFIGNIIFTAFVCSLEMGELDRLNGSLQVEAIGPFTVEMLTLGGVTLKREQIAGLRTVNVSGDGNVATGIMCQLSTQDQELRAVVPSV